MKIFCKDNIFFQKTEVRSKNEIHVIAIGGVSQLVS